MFLYTKSPRSHTQWFITNKIYIYIYFLISNIRNFIKKSNQVHWKCTTVAQIKNPDYNDQ